MHYSGHRYAARAMRAQRASVEIHFQKAGFTKGGYAQVISRAEGAQVGIGKFGGGGLGLRVCITFGCNSQVSAGRWTRSS